MALTLVEAAKIAVNNGEFFRSAIIEKYAKSSDILRVLPIDDIPGNALSYNREETLPGIGFRGINEAYTESTGVVNPITETLAIAGGDLDVDTAIIKGMGKKQRSIQELMKVKALSLAWTRTFIKGSNATEPREFDGLQVRFIGDQLIAAGATSGGDALSLVKLDELIDAVDEPGFLIMSKAVRRLLTVASRTAAVGGDIQREVNEFGDKVALYNGLPILIADKDNTNTKILDFNEVNPGGGANVGTSIYCISVGDGKLTGIQNGEVEVRDLGELQTKPSMRTRLEWMVGIAFFHGQAGGRLHGIKNAAVTA